MDQHEDSIEALAREDTIQLQKHSWIRRHWIRLISILIIVVFSAAIFVTGGLSDDLWALGYLGVFLVSILGSVVILVPIPSLPVVFLMGMLLNPFLVGLMVGLGERIPEFLKTIADIRYTGCDLLTVGQYLAPSREHFPVARFVEPAEFDRMRVEAEDMGFAAVAAGPFVRSSYQAESLFKDAR